MSPPIYIGVSYSQIIEIFIVAESMYLCDSICKVPPCHCSSLIIKEGYGRQSPPIIWCTSHVTTNIKAAK